MDNVENACAKCKKCCTNTEYIGLMTQEEIDTIEKKVGRKVEKEIWKGGIYGTEVFAITEKVCPAFKVGVGCTLTTDVRPVTCLLFPYRPDFDEDSKVWNLDLAVTKCPYAISVYSKHFEEAKALFQKMIDNGRWIT